MYRSVLKQFETWKESPSRKPLIVKGVRQVGKTWLMKEFGRLHYADTAYFNFDENPELNQLFTGSKDVNRILQNLTMATGQKITPGKTLVIFDEVQDAPEVIGSLKYFCENIPELHVVCAGSLLGVALARPGSSPVGKVNFLEVRPMTFREFLLASGKDGLVTFMKAINTLTPIPDAFASQLAELLKFYFITGGMPESVKDWTEHRDVNEVQSILSELLETYARDFAKHPETKQFPKLSLIWKSIPSQLARENKKFLYSVVKEGARAREYEDALQWIVEAGLFIKVYRSNAPKIPAVSYDDLSAFKIYLSDVGLLRRHCRLHPSAITERNRLFTEFKGALAENYVLQALTLQYEDTPRYWSRINPSHEVDFLIQRGNQIIPIEVKADENLSGDSLKIFAKLFPDDTRLRVRFSMRNLCLNGCVLNIPLYLADETDRLIGMALEELEQKKS